MTLADLQTLNPNLHIKDIKDTSFKTYGEIIHLNLNDVINAVNKLYQVPTNGNKYEPSIENLENEIKIKQLMKQVYGYLPVMAGVVLGHNRLVNGLEYHQCSETIIAVTDYVLVVGHRWDLIDQTYDSSNCEFFYVPKGCVVECYATSLHYTPIAVDQYGFKTICLLLKGTGQAIENRLGILKKVNKWFITHKENLDKVQAGDVVGLLGNMIEINH